jgi:DNA primase
MAHQCDFTETIATLGTAMTDSHAVLLRRYTDRVILLFDSDEAGQRAADRALSVSLTSGLDVALARVPEGKDPCDYLLSAGALAFSELLKVAVPALEFKWHLLTKEFQAGATGPARRRAIESLLQQISAWIGRGALDPIQMGFLVNQLSKVLSLPAEGLHRELTGWARKNSASSKQTQVQVGDAEHGHSHAEQEAYRQLIEMLLNEPQRYAEIEDILVPSSIHDPALSEVAQELVSLLRANPVFELSDLIRRFESPAFGQLITDLQIRGQQRGDYSADIDGARQRLLTASQLRRTWELAGAIRDPQPESQEENLTALADSVKHPHFASARARRRLLER